MAWSIIDDGGSAQRSGIIAFKRNNQEAERSSGRYKPGIEHLAVSATIATTIPLDEPPKE
ncbi:hypothetical protein [Sphingomonas alpina]|uniref:Uncharacterized protein n=1 Tax=Sphingomonas alpina TaxID=653931 RepID=A0A7H0LN31_9SPHN|nr:hypothetical protein [Sphingomonas alpina]QNQ11084.1 hypothetical protein H3Z74_07995 [Sphingomonas alpina]